MTRDTFDHPPGCICRDCADLWEEMEAADIDVCQNCGAYFEWRKGQKWQRCSKCRAGLEAA